MAFLHYGQSAQPTPTSSFPSFSTVESSLGLLVSMSFSFLQYSQKNFKRLPFMDVLELYTSSIIAHIGYGSCSSMTTNLWWVICGVLVHVVDLLLSSLLTNRKIMVCYQGCILCLDCTMGIKMVYFTSGTEAFYWFSFLIILQHSIVI